MLFNRSFDVSAVLDERALCAARLRGAEAALERAGEAALLMDGVNPSAVEESGIAPPELTRCCEDPLSIHVLTSDIVAAHVLARTTPDELAVIESNLAAAWEEGRDAVWSDAVRATAIRSNGCTEEAREIERTNDNYVDSLRACRDRGAASST